MTSGAEKKKKAFTASGRKGDQLHAVVNQRAESLDAYIVKEFKPRIRLKLFYCMTQI